MERATKRLVAEYRQLCKNPPEGVTAGPVSASNLLQWHAVIVGPDDTPYEGGCFNALLTFPANYPFNPPSMQFISNVWHPNIYKDRESVYINSSCPCKFVYSCARRLKLLLISFVVLLLT